MTSGSLYDIQENERALDELLEESGGEITPEIEAWMAEYSVAERDKVDGYGDLYEDWKVKAEGCKAAADRLTLRRRTFENKMEALKRLAGDALAVRGLKKVEGTRHFIRRQAAGKPPVVVNVEPERLPAEFQKVTITADKEKIRAALEAGIVMPVFTPAGILAPDEPEEFDAEVVEAATRPIAYLGERSVVVVIQ